MRRHCVRRGERAQAVVEMAMVIPILLYITFGFIGAMILVQTQQELQTALQLAAQSSFQADEGTPYSGDPGYPNELLDCYYAQNTFDGTMSFYDQYITFTSQTICSQCDVYPGPSDDCPAGSQPMGHFQCTLNNWNAAQNVHLDTCTATATLDFSRTPVGFAIFWNPRLKVQAQAIPPPFRQ